MQIPPANPTLGMTGLEFFRCLFRRPDGLGRSL
jgi:hypothetical protein